MIDQLFESLKDDLLPKLREQPGIESGEAEPFFNRAVQMIRNVISDGDFDVSSLLQGDLGGLMEKLDLGSLTGLISGGEDAAKGGLEKMLQGAMEKVGGDDGGDLLGKLTGGDLGGLMGKMFGG